MFSPAPGSGRLNLLCREVAILGADQKERGLWGREWLWKSSGLDFRTSSFTAHAWLDLYGVILVPRAHDPSGLCQESRALAGPDFLSMRRVLVSYYQPIRFARFDGKSVNRGLPVLDKARALDSCHRPEGSWALGTRMIWRLYCVQR